MVVRNRWSPRSWGFGPRLWNTVKENWYLGFTSFGGPPVHFKIYQELFSVCQAFSGPGSTKMHYCINLIHDGFLPAVLGFLFWSLPGALGMFGLAIGISNVGETLPRVVYALLSGLNAATVGIIALAGVQLAQKAITDQLTRLLVFLGAAAGLLYNALWYFPVLMLIAGTIAVVHDFRWLHGPVKAVAGLPRRLMGRRRKDRETGAERGQGQELEDITPEQQPAPEPPEPAIARPAAAASSIKSAHSTSSNTRNRLPITTADLPPPSHHPSPPATPTASSPTAAAPAASVSPRTIPASHRLPLSWKSGLALIVLFLASFVVVLVLRGILPHPPLPYRLFANLYLAGTIIFGGGPVVIPLLREYVVSEGWVSPRDFLIGLAIIQSFPGPNFNFAVFLGALTAAGGGYHPALGAVLGYLGIFLPGLVTVHGTMGLWAALRSKRWVKSALRGVNAAAVGLIYTAVYRLWQIGWIDEGFERGTSLAEDPWWVVVTATSYVGGCWFGVSPPMACVMGAVLGLVRYAVVVEGQGL
ncbi:Chromate transport protein [Madurella mycetomatis]|uniref:Chromate transport protein n=1 Tax=Madurella mycetomatis TaxID=100816 RepID=A0A175VVL6_9PEZI|nr:Chromate transport protein [Madurella mycetomatis]